MTTPADAQTFDAPETAEGSEGAPAMTGTGSDERESEKTPSPAGLPAIDKYELLEEIGHGGMATVYRARDPRLGREVAIKVIHKHLRENVEVATRFVAEARAAAKLRHRGIVEVYDVSTEDDKERYLVVELLRGCTLRKILQQHRDMPAEVGAAIVLELCDALEHAHASGIIHRDVKPENVLVELPCDRAAPSGRDGASQSASAPSDSGVVVKLTDFGIAKLLDAQGMTSTGQVLGSPAHMAPEQIEGGEVDARTDVFAIGVLMYECLVGHLPFEGKNPAQMLRRVLEGAYPAPDRERPSVGGRWARILAGALAHDAEDRIATPGALAELIRAELSALDVTDPCAEIVAYFDAPEHYTEEHPARLVPRLVARAEASRRRGDVPGAAADYNRALALRPHDLTILKRISSLTSSASRRRLARRAIAVVGGSAILGVAAFGVARYLRASTVPLASTAGPVVPSVQVDPVPQPREHDPPDTSPSATSSASTARPRLTKPPPVLIHPPDITTAAVDTASPRNVRFSIIPSGARLVLDGRETPWFGQTFSLRLGPHSVQITVPNSKCCKPMTASVTVTPSMKTPPEPQVIVLKLDLLPATVRLAGAPPNSQYSCPGIALSGFAGSTKTVTLPEVAWSGRCDFRTLSDARPRSDTVTLRAGETNTISWPR